MRKEEKNRFKKAVKRSVALLGGAAYVFIAGMLLFGANGKAYIDPSVMTYIIQAVSGIVIAIGAAVGIYWRKVRKKLNEKFEVDENKNKEMESDDIEVYKE